MKNKSLCGFVFFGRTGEKPWLAEGDLSHGYSEFEEAIIISIEVWALT